MRKLVQTIAIVALVLLASVVVFDAGAPEPAPDRPSARAGAGPSAGVTLERQPRRRVIQPDEPASPRPAVPPFERELASVSGRLVDAEGQPVEGVAVAVQVMFADLSVSNEPAQPEAPRWHHGRDVSGRDGRFEIAGLVPDSRLIVTTEPHPEWALAAAVTTLDGPCTRPGRELDLGDLQLHRCASITGVIRDAAGRPIPGAAVGCKSFADRGVAGESFDAPGPNAYVIVGERDPFSLHPDVPMRAFPPRHRLTRARAGDDGAFTLRGLPPGGQVVIAHVPGRRLPVSTSVRCAAGEGVDLGALVLDGRDLRGRVVDHDGRPVAGAMVVVAPGGTAEYRFGVRIGDTDAAGRFAISGCPVETVIVAARRSRGQRWDIESNVPASAEIVVRLSPSYDVSVRVVGADGRPVERPELRLYAGDEATGNALGLHPASDRRVPIGARAEPVAAGETRIGGLSAGRYRVHATAGELGSASELFDLPGPRERVLRLAPDRGIRVEVVTGDGTPVPRVLVTVDSRPVGRTGDDGTLELDPIGERPRRVYVARPGFGPASLEVAGSQREVRIVLSEIGRLEGRIRVEGASPRFLGWTVKFGRSQRAKVDASGRFFVQGPKSGRDRIESILDDAGREVRFAVDGGSDVWFDVREGRTTRLDVQAEWRPREALGRVRGTVFLDGRPAVGRVVEYTDPRTSDEMSAEIDSAGRFDIGEVFYPRVLLRLGALNPHAVASDLWQGFVDVRRGETTEIALDLETGSVSGRVVGPDGRPATDAMVLATAKDLTARAVDTDEHGRFEIAQILTGVYELYVTQDGLRGGVGGVRVDPGRLVSGVTIELRETVAVSGRVELSGLGIDPVPARVAFVGEVEETERVSGVSGAFEVEGLYPGSYRVALVFGSRYRLTLHYPEPIAVGEAGRRHLVLVFGASYLPSIRAEVVRMGFRDFEHYLQAIRK